MELFAPTRQERDKWVMIFNLLIEMNKKLMSTKLITPLCYKRKRDCPDRVEENVKEQKSEEGM